MNVICLLFMLFHKYLVNLEFNYDDIETKDPIITSFKYHNLILYLCLSFNLLSFSFFRSTNLFPIRFFK